MPVLVGPKNSSDTSTAGAEVAMGIDDREWEMNDVAVA